MARPLLAWPVPPFSPLRQTVNSRARRMLPRMAGGATWGDGELDSDSRPGFEPVLPLKMGHNSIDKRSMRKRRMW